MNTAELVEKLHGFDILSLKVPNYEQLLGKAAYNNPAINSTTYALESIHFGGFVFSWLTIISVATLLICFIYQKFVKKNKDNEMLLSFALAVAAFAGIFVILLMTWDMHDRTTQLIRLYTEFMSKR